MSLPVTTARRAGPAVLALFGAVALGGVDVETGPRAKVRGTIVPTGETEVLRIEAPASSSLSFTALAKKKGTLDLALVLEAPGGAPVDLDGARSHKDTHGRIAVQKLPLPASGVYTLRLTAVGTGEYSLDVSVSPKTRFGAASVVDAGKSARIAFSAPAGASVAMVAKAAKKSAAQPRFGMFGATDLSTSGKFTSKSHSVKPGRVAVTGDYEVEVRNVGAVSGGIDVTIVVTPARPRTRSLDVRGIDGSAAGVVRWIDAELGAAVELDEEPGPLAGCVMTVPPGALARDTQISIRSSLTATVADPATQQAAGPTASFGPPGTKFASPVTLRLPYDPSAFPRGSDPVTDLRVVRREKNGSATTLTPSAVLPADSMYEVQTSGFSDFVPVAPLGPPTLDGRSYWTVRLAQVYEDSATDTRGREFRVRIGAVDLSPAKSFTLEGSERVVTVDHTGAQAGQIVGEVGSTTTPVSATGAWAYVPGAPENVTFDGDEFATTEDGKVLCGSVIQASDRAPDLHLFTAKPAFPLVRADVVGTYWITRLAVTPRALSGQPADVTFARLFGTLELRSNGTCRLVRDEVTWHYDRTKGYDVETTAHLTHTGEFAIAGPEVGAFEGSISVQAGPYAWRLLPDHDARVLAGTDLPEGTASILVGVRRSTDLPSDALTGTYAAYSLSAQTGAEYTVDGVPVPDWISYDVHQTWRLSGAGTLDYKFDGGAAVGRSSGGGVYTSVTGPIPTLQFARLEPEASGFHRILPSTFPPGGDDIHLMGAFSPDGSFAFSLHDPESRSDNLLQFMVRTER